MCKTCGYNHNKNDRLFCDYYEIYLTAEELYYDNCSNHTNYKDEKDINHENNS